MFVLKKSRPCEEALCVISYVEDIMAGKKVDQPELEYHIHEKRKEIGKRLSTTLIGLRPKVKK